jgi:hypothetical protein
MRIFVNLTVLFIVLTVDAFSVDLASASERPENRTNVFCLATMRLKKAKMKQAPLSDTHLVAEIRNSFRIRTETLDMVLVLGSFDQATGAITELTTFLEIFRPKGTEDSRSADEVPRFYFSKTEVLQDGKLLIFTGAPENHIDRIVVKLNTPYSPLDRFKKLDISKIFTFFSDNKDHSSTVQRIWGDNQGVAEFDQKVISPVKWVSKDFSGPLAKEILAVLPEDKSSWSRTSSGEEIRSYRDATILVMADGNIEFLSNELSSGGLAHLRRGLRGLGLRKDHPIFGD